MLWLQFASRIRATNMPLGLFEPLIVAEMIANLVSLFILD